MSAKKSVAKPRADALRNRERLIDEAKVAFAALGPEVSLEEIARRAEVGIGTLYRHFPTRDELVESVYRHEVQQLAESAERLLASETATAALRAWLTLFVDYVDAKKVILSALAGRAGGTSALFEGSRELMRTTVARLIEAGITRGELRSDVQSDDLLRALAGFSFGLGTKGWRESTLRLVEVLMDGLRAPRRAAGARARVGTRVKKPVATPSKRAPARKTR